MQISGNSLLAGLGLLQQPQAGAKPPIDPQPQTKPRPAQAPAPQAAAASRLTKAQNLEQAVQALADQGQLPPRGSLIDLRA